MSYAPAKGKPTNAYAHSSLPIVSYYYRAGVNGNIDRELWAH